MRRVRLVADARREFLREIQDYEQERKGLGRRFREAAKAAFVRAGEQPTTGKPAIGGTRRILVHAA